jgi:hypothetical protein
MRDIGTDRWIIFKVHLNVIGYESSDRDYAVSDTDPWRAPVNTITSIWCL